MSSRRHKVARSRSSESEEDDYSPSLPTSTSKLTNLHLASLGLTFQNVSNPDQFFAHLLSYQPILEHSLFLPQLKVKGDIDNLNEEMMEESPYREHYSLIRSLKQICEISMVEVERESQTDTFLANLLIEVGFNSFPFYAQHKPYMEGVIGQDNITSIADYAVLKKQIFVILNENKSGQTKTFSSGFGEAQIAGELLITSQKNNIDERTRTLFAIRAINTKLTFYRVDITNQYINSTYQGYPVKEQCQILRYPAEDYRQPDIKTIRALDFTILEQRREIISILLNIKNYLLSI